MTMVYQRDFLSAGDIGDYLVSRTIIAQGHSFMEESDTTMGDIDKDYLSIKASAETVNLAEEEAYNLIDKIRSKLEINKDE